MIALNEQKKFSFLESLHATAVENNRLLHKQSLNLIFSRKMPAISNFFGITIRMYYDDHAPPHFHAEYQGQTGSFDFSGRLLAGT